MGLMLMHTTIISVHFFSIEEELHWSILSSNSLKGHRLIDSVIFPLSPFFTSSHSLSSLLLTSSHSLSSLFSLLQGQVQHWRVWVPYPQRGWIQQLECDTNAVTLSPTLTPSTSMSICQQVGWPKLVAKALTRIIMFLSVYAERLFLMSSRLAAWDS